MVYTSTLTKQIVQYSNKTKLNLTKLDIFSREFQLIKQLKMFSQNISSSCSDMKIQKKQQNYTLLKANKNNMYEFRH